MGYVTKKFNLLNIEVDAINSDTTEEKLTSLLNFKEI